MEGKIHQYSDLSSAQCQQARLARDARFDGLFFIAFGPHNISTLSPN